MYNKSKLFALFKRILEIIKNLYDNMRYKTIIVHYSLYSINLNTTKFNLIRFPYKKLTDEFICKIVLDCCTIEGFVGWKYIHIFADNGILVSVVSWYIDDLFFKDMDEVDNILYDITTTIQSDCGQYVLRAKSSWALLNIKTWGSFSNTTFYINIGDEDYYNLFK